MTRRRRSERSHASAQHLGTPRRDQQDQETIKLANEYLAKHEILKLRKLVAVRGLVNHGLRRRVWPLLLGVQGQPHDERDYTSKSETPHKDGQVVVCDMARSLWSWTEGWNDDARTEKRAALKRILGATCAGNAGEVYYYQGLHDVAAVLLFVCGEQSAFRMLSRLANCHLRDCTRPTLDASVEVLSLLYPIMQAADPELYSFIASFEEPALEVPYFALSWLMTWFSHDVPALDQCARLFDLFLSSHPLMPLYVAAVAVRGQRQAVLKCGQDGGDMVYAALKGMEILGEGRLSADELARQAVELYRIVPPEQLQQRQQSRLLHSTTPFAYIEEERWQVPEEPKLRRGRLGALQRLLPALETGSGRIEPRRKKKKFPGGKFTAMVITGIAGAAVLTTTLFMQMHMLSGDGGGGPAF